MSRETARYTYTAGSRPEGVAVYDSDSSCTSHHDTDPARGTHGAFDLVRLHRFGHLDKEAGELPITERPSYKAMCEFAEALPEIRTARGGLEDLGPLPEAPAADIPPMRFEFKAASDYVKQPPIRWIIPGILPQAELAVIYGASGSGKSFLGYDMAAAISRGAEWNGRQTVKGSVAYIAAEGGHGMVSRIRAYAERNGGFDDLPRITRAAPNLMDVKDAAAIVQGMQQSGPYVAVILDTFSRSHQGNENSGDDMGKVLKHCQFIHEKTGAVVVWIHHTGRDESRGQRGWSGLRAAADAEIEVTCDPAKNRAWSTAKVKDGPDDIRGDFKLDVVPLGQDEQGQEITSCVVQHLEQAPGKPKRERLTAGQRKARDVLRKLSPTGEPVAFDDVVTALIKAKGYKAEEVQGYHKRDARKAYYELRDLGEMWIDEREEMCRSGCLIRDNEAWLQ